MSPGSEGSQVPLRLWNAGQVTVLSLDDVCGEKQGEIFSQQVCGESSRWCLERQPFHGFKRFVVLRGSVGSKVTRFSGQNLHFQSTKKK